MIFATIAAITIVGVWILRYNHSREIEVNDNISKFEIEELKDDKSYVLSISPRGDKAIVCTNDDNELVLHLKSNDNATSKVIYNNYSPISDDPYSMYNAERYNIQWCQNERYIFVRDSIYDIETDKMIEIKSNVAFMWVGNKGLYLDNGHYYTMEFDDGYSNYMAISKKINIFDAGNIKTLASSEDDKYFVLDNIYMQNMFDIEDDCLIMNTASLKHKAEDLQEIINKEYSGMVKAIYEEKKIGRYEYPENVIANGSYYLENIKSIKIPLD